MKNTLFIALLTCFVVNIGFGQKAKKWQQALNGLEQSDFIETFKEHKNNIETRMEEFHRDAAALSDDEIAEVGQAYTDSKKRFDKILDKMKVHFTDKDTRKMMTKNADIFLNGYRYDLDEAYKFYLNECQSLADVYTSSEEGQFIGQITLLVGLIQEFYNIYQNIAGKMKNMTEEYFEDNFASKLRLKEWSAFQGI